MKTVFIKSILLAAALLALAQFCFAHDISIFDVGTRITLWVNRDKVRLGFLLDLKNFPAQDMRKKCDLNKDMEIDESEREHYIKVCCRELIDNLEMRINGGEMGKEITRTDVYGFQGPVDRNPFSTYIEAEIDMDPSLYRVKIEYKNKNFENEEPQIINDVNLSISKRLDNLKIYPITPIVQYIDRETAENLFMEMTLDRHFFIEYGYRDVGSEKEPFIANEIMLTKDSGETSRKARSGTPAPATSKSQKKLYKWLQDFTMEQVEDAMKATGAGVWAWLVFIGVVVGMIHVFLPGHGKTVIGSYVVATHAKAGDAVKLALLVTMFHTISTCVLAAFIMLIADRLVTTVQNIAVIYLTLISGGLVVLIGLYMLFLFDPASWREEEKREEEFTEETIKKSGQRKSKFSLMWKIALATGIIPCITSSYAASLFIFYQEYAKAFLMILFIAIGQAITLSMIGFVASGGFKAFKWLASKEKSGAFMWLVERLHKPAALALVVIGLSGIWLGYQFLAATKSSAQPMTAEERIASYEKELEKDPQDAEAHFSLGLLYAGRDEMDKAFSHFDEVPETYGEYAKALKFRGHILAKKKKYEEAAEFYRKALEKTPDDGNVFFNLAWVEEKLDKTKEAIEHYGRAGELGENEALFNLGLIYETQSRLDHALEAYLDAADARPGESRILMAIADVYRIKKEYEKALEYLLKVHEKNQKSKEVNLAIANIYMRRLDKSEEAKSYLEAYLENGGQREIEEAIAALDGKKLRTPGYQKWEAPEEAEQFSRIGAPAAQKLVALAREQEGEQLKTTLSAIGLTEAPQAVGCILEIFNDGTKWTGEDIYRDCGPEIGTPALPHVAKEVFQKCMRRSCVEAVMRELVRVYRGNNNREYFLKEIFFDSCCEYPFESMDALLANIDELEGPELKNAIDLAFYLKNEALTMAQDDETLKAFVTYLKKWWSDNRDKVKWDETNRFFYTEE